MKRIIILLIIAILALSACAAPSGAEQGGTTNSTVLASNSTASTTVSTVPTTSTKPTTMPTTVPTTASTEPTTVTTTPTTVTTIPTTVSTEPTTNTTKPTTNTTKPTASTTMPATIPTMPTSSTSQLEDGLLYRGNQLKVYGKNGKYSFDILVGGSVEFSLDRVVIRAVLVEPIKYGNYQKLLNYSFDDVKSMFGEPHFEEGSGMYIPSYITEDAYIIRFYPQYDGSIESVVLFDPIHNEIVEIWNVHGM